MRPGTTPRSQWQSGHQGNSGHSWPESKWNKLIGNMPRIVIWLTLAEKCLASLKERTHHHLAFLTVLFIKLGSILSISSLTCFRKHVEYVLITKNRQMPTETTWRSTAQWWLQISWWVLCGIRRTIQWRRMSWGNWEITWRATLSRCTSILSPRQWNSLTRRQGG